MAEQDFVSGFARGLTVIEAFGEAAPRMAIADIAKATGLDRATSRRCLLTLFKLGYADYDGKFFSLTPKVLSLGHAYLSATPLPKLVQPHLDLLSDKAGQSASVSVLEGNEIVYIARSAQRRVMSINLAPGSRLPAYCTSMGRILLAALPEDQASRILANTELKKNTEKTLTDTDTLMKELRSVRTEGYATVDQELEIGLCSIAVPVENARGQTIAAINIGASSALVPASAMAEQYLPLLRETQNELRQVLR